MRHLYHEFVPDEAQKKETRKERLTRKLYQKALGCGAISAFRAKKAERERQTEKDRKRLASRMLGCVPKEIKTLLDINVLRVELIIDNAPGFMANIAFFFGKNARAGGCQNPEELDAALKVLRKSWKDVVEITCTHRIEQGLRFAELSFKIL